MTFPRPNRGLAGCLGLALALLAPSSAPARSSRAPDAHANIRTRIADEGFNRSEVAETAAYLSDRIGARLTNSPGMREAERWTQRRFRDWGLADVRKEGFRFGRGWWIERASARMTSPRPLDLRAIPVAWTPPTAGALSAKVVVAPMTSEADFQQWRGRLRGLFVLVSFPTPPVDAEAPDFVRLSDDDLRKLARYEPPVAEPEAEFERRYAVHVFERRLDALLKSEGAVAWARMSPREGRLVHGTGYGFEIGETPSLPAVELAAEDYRRIVRLAREGPVTIEIDSRVHYDDGDPNAYNIVADLPGRDPAAGIVMAGAHLDSWAAGDGAADNAAGSAIVMEAARILRRIGARPKRSIRFALWSGEEQGLLGSFAYVERHLARRPPPASPDNVARGPYWRLETFPVTPRPDYQRFAGYFNVDSGSGRIRGIYAENNFAAAERLKSWLAPYAALGASTVILHSTGRTDHVPFSRLGLPAFQFVQDRLDYRSRVHHSDLDTFDHLRVLDLRQAAVILAGLLFSAANEDEPVPARPLPSGRGAPADPFVHDMR